VRFRTTRDTAGVSWSWAAFVVQVTPSLWAAYRTPRPSGASAGTWALILGELACFLAYGVHQGDPRLIGFS
jgi:hypothetical protein